MGSKIGKYGNGISNGSAGGPANGLHTVTALSRWSILSSQLPAVDKINTIHVYDFDNTLFQTPLPNPKIWNSATLGRLQGPDIFANGGWWHDSRILAATGDGVEREEPRAWAGWWNEKIVELVQLSMKQKDALCVLLTGRSERGFTDLIKRIVTSRGLEFDMMGLKPEVGPNSERFGSTMLFKQAFLVAMMETYKHAQEIRIYEDRPKHTAGFRDFLAYYNEQQRDIHNQPSRGPILAEVIQVADISTNLDPVVEVAEVQHLINSHNALVGSRTKRGRSERLTIRKTVFYTSYMIKPEDTKRLIALATPHLPENEVKYQANAIIITAKPCPPQVLEKVGGLHAKLRWGVKGIGSWDNCLWAISLQAIPDSAPYHTDSSTPSVVIATRRAARPSDVNKIQQWQPIAPDKVFAFETEVGEKVMLRIESEEGPDDESDGFASQKSRRKYAKIDGDDRPQRSASGGYGQNNSRGYHTSTYQGRGGSRGGGFRGGPSGRGYRGAPRGRGGGRGGRGGYRSLDDLGTREGQGGVSYDDNFPALGNSASSQPGPPAQPNQLFPQQQGQWQPPSGPPSGFGAGATDLQKFY
ncbi:putative tat pathway signal sequence protein [Rosellinia necatrix]|uniref:Putative tat pathway signal sequence protein n=1 Tax=Rosellinia necatrix TaxID=77044 RepID=A0A1S7UNX7_ROSNE|nr:putative tat pathway signal sequence protein [Rosellinia necatrix]